MVTYWPGQGKGPPKNTKKSPRKGATTISVSVSVSVFFPASMFVWETSTSKCV